MADKPYRKGIPEKTSGGGNFVKVGDGEAAVFAPLIDLDQLITIDLHGFWNLNPAILVPCMKEDCPACATGDTPSERSYLPVRLRSGEVQILSGGPMIINQLLDIREEIGTVHGKVFKLSRKGTGLSTRWRVTGLGKTVDVADIPVPDILSAIGPFDRTAIAKKLIDAGLLEKTKAAESVDSIDEEDIEDVEEDW